MCDFTAIPGWDEFANLAQTYKSQQIRRTLKDWVQVAETLEKEHGELPPLVWLRANGYNNLPKTMKDHPHAFMHIKKRKLRKMLDAHIADAEKLTSIFGEIPGVGWCIKNGYPQLHGVMRYNKTEFKRFKKAKRSNGNFLSGKIILMTNGIKTEFKSYASIARLLGVTGTAVAAAARKGGTVRGCRVYYNEKGF